MVNNCKPDLFEAALIRFREKSNDAKEDHSKVWNSLRSLMKVTESREDKSDRCHRLVRIPGRSTESFVREALRGVDNSVKNDLKRICLLIVEIFDPVFKVYNAHFSNTSIKAEDWRNYNKFCQHVNTIL